MSEDRFDEFLRQAARDYNAPPDTPREAMWARIEAERRARAARRTAGPVHRRVWWGVALAVAAALLIGIGIGRTWRQPEPGAARVAVAGNERERAPVRPEPGGTDSAPLGVPPSAAPGTSAARANAPGTQREGPRDVARDVPGGALRAVGAPRAYEVAAIEHLGRAEALLTAFRAESKRGEVDAQVPMWASDLLGTTRLLLDSPATRDPRLRALLGDLEVVLAQIAQLRPQQPSTPDELQLIDQALRRRDVMTRLRTNTPVGAFLAGS